MTRSPLIALLLLWGCAPTSVPPTDDDAIARYRGGHITASDLDQAVLALPAADRLSLSATDLEPFRNLVRELTVDRLLMAEARDLGRDQTPALEVQRRGLERQAIAKGYLERLLPPIPEPTEEELRAAFNERQADLQQPETRSVMHIYRRRLPQVPLEQLTAP